MKKAIFLDRDGTLIENGEGYQYKKEQLSFLPGVLEGLKHIKTDYLLFIITNQSGIGRGYYTKEDFLSFNSLMLKKLNDNGIRITKTYFCPHAPGDACECRKPSPFYILKAKEEYNLDLNKSWMIGDSETDIGSASAAGIKGIMVCASLEEQQPSVVSDFSKAIKLIGSYD